MRMTSLVKRMRSLLPVLYPIARGCSRKIMMAGNSSSTHMERTQDCTRSDMTSEVTVTNIQQLSPTLKGFTLHVANKQLSFKPGQWVDLHIPAVETVGGYSFTSAPYQLKEKGSFNLVIQYSDHSPTLWMSTKCKVGDRLSVQVGGDFWYSPASPQDLLLVGGGVGINPLFSMLQHHAWLLQQGSLHDQGAKMEDCETCSAQLLFSAKSVSELLFKETIDQICSKNIRRRYFVTQEKNTALSDITCRRIQAADVAKAVSELNLSRLQCFICGPPPMIEDVRQFLSDCSVPSDAVHFEKWW